MTTNTFSLPTSTEALLNEQLETLPEYVQDALLSFDWRTTTVALAAKHRLPADKTVRLVLEVAMLLHRLTEVGVFRSEVVAQVGISQTVADTLMKDIADRILNPLQEYILENNKELIGALQDDVARREREMQQSQQLSEEGISIDEDPLVFGTPSPTPQQAFADQVLAGTGERDGFTDISITPTTAQPPAYKGTDPYHEPVE